MYTISKICQFYRCQQASINQEILFQNLKEENQRLRAHTTTEASVSTPSNDLLPFQPKSEKFAKALCKNNDNKSPQSVTFTGNPQVEVGEIPFHVALGFLSSYENETDYRCGGSLIADDIVLTAAHCVNRRDDKPLTVKLGRVCIGVVHK